MDGGNSVSALRAINAKLREDIRKQNKKLRSAKQTLLIAATAFKFHQNHEMAAMCMDAWRKEVPE